MKIQDGAGSGKWLKVDSEGRALTSSVSITDQRDKAIVGKSYQVGTGAVVLTSANESAVLYIENNEDKDIIFTGVNITSTAQTGATSNVFLVKIYLGSTGLSGGAATAALNNNFGSSRALDATITAGAEAATLTGGTASGAFYIPEETFFNTDISWVLPKGVSLGVTITPAASNTTLVTTLTVEGHLAD